MPSASSRPIATHGPWSRCKTWLAQGTDNRQPELKPPGTIRIGDAARLLWESQQPSIVETGARRQCDTAASPSPRHSACDLRDTSRQRNTHSTESRQVRYPWHPWFGRAVTVSEAPTRCGQRVCQCGFDDSQNDRSLEVPAWMLESAKCDHLRLAGTPTVGCDALVELSRVLRGALRADRLQAQHHSLNAEGGADAAVLTPSTTLAADPVSSASTSDTPALSDAPARHPAQGDSITGPTAPSPRRPGARRRRSAGGGS
jgi:hypothetical protein